MVRRKTRMDPELRKPARWLLLPTMVEVAVVFGSPDEVRARTISHRMPATNPGLLMYRSLSRPFAEPPIYHTPIAAGAMTKTDEGVLPVEPASAKKEVAIGCAAVFSDFDAPECLTYPDPLDEMPALRRNLVITGTIQLLRNRRTQGALLVTYIGSPSLRPAAVQSVTSVQLTPSSSPGPPNSIIGLQAPSVSLA